MARDPQGFDLHLKSVSVQLHGDQTVSVSVFYFTDDRKYRQRFHKVTDGVGMSAATAVLVSARDALLALGWDSDDVAWAARALWPAEDA